MLHAVVGRVEGNLTGPDVLMLVGGVVETSAVGGAAGSLEDAVLVGTALGCCQGSLVCRIVDCRLCVCLASDGSHLRCDLLHFIAVAILREGERFRGYTFLVTAHAGENCADLAGSRASEEGTAIPLLVIIQCIICLED